MISLKNLKQFTKKYIIFKEPKPVEEFILEESPGEAGHETNDKQAITNKYSIPTPPNKNVSSSIFENMEYLKSRFNMPSNSDVVIREFDITVKKDS